jgi:ornithine lipid ester-linked acyl 2-hydroxylase
MSSDNSNTDLADFERAIRAADGDRRFFDPAQFAWTREVEQAWRPMRAELDRVLRALDILPGFEDIQVEQQGLTNDKRWKVFPLFVYGAWITKTRQRCPATVAALEKIPGLQAAMFSILQAGKELAAHRGPYAGVLRYHLGLKVPQPESSCCISVDGELRSWREGASLVFDDSHEHFAWNRSDEDRVVLFADFTRPLPERLRGRNQQIIEAISSTDFMRGAVKRWNEWEARHGERLDESLSPRGPAQADAVNDQ